MIPKSINHWRLTKSVLASVTGKKIKVQNHDILVLKNDFLLFDAAVDVQQCAMGNMIIFDNVQNR